MNGPPPLLRVDTGDPTPPYEQLRRQLAGLIGSGTLAPGDRLPPLRQLAADLGLAVGTVARAYRELELAGLVEKRRTAGTYVSDQGSPLARRERVKILSERIDALLAEARQMDIAFDDVVKLVQQREAALQTTRSEE